MATQTVNRQIVQASGLYRFVTNTNVAFMGKQIDTIFGRSHKSKDQEPPNFVAIGGGEHKLLSRQHFRIYWQPASLMVPEGWYLQALSTNSTVVDGVEVKKEQAMPLQSHSRIETAGSIIGHFLTPDPHVTSYVLDYIAKHQAPQQAAAAQPVAAASAQPYTTPTPTPATTMASTPYVQTLTHSQVQTHAHAQAQQLAMQQAALQQRQLLMMGHGAGAVPPTGVDPLAYQQQLMAAQAQQQQAYYHAAHGQYRGS